MIAALDDIKTRIMPQIASKALVPDDQDVSVEAGQDLDGYDFLRVLIRLPKRVVADATLEELLESIEDSVAEIDERYVSVRFEEAA